jgi:antitoxin component of MazEF toxin-antitoxin module
MVKSLTKVGNSHAILLDRAIMDLLGLDEKSRVTLTVSGGSLIVTPVEPVADQEKFEAAAERAEKKFANLLKQLA